MSQIKQGKCVQEFLPRPALEHRSTPTFLSKLSQTICNQLSEPARRSDNIPQKYGAGIATLASSRRDIWGIANPSHVRTYEHVNTNLDPILLPNEGFQDAQYMPSISTLNFLKHTQGTRLPTHPDRFF